MTRAGLGCNSRCGVAVVGKTNGSAWGQPSPADRVKVSVTPTLRACHGNCKGSEGALPASLSEGDVRFSEKLEGKVAITFPACFTKIQRTHPRTLVQDNHGNVRDEKCSLLRPGRFYLPVTCRQDTL